ncbi:hypothetical protein KM176_16065 [Pseudooceanicola sp. CBS1P-1]|uniref:Tripartite tricarboxylate transporter substrate binding protein n=1 Tax=Pseudooceanicola albus TaxID=2692189 RepID=A0A6L7G4X4_9RHOB|nr:MULTISPECIES: tripartite tricarboxylate transporter substrate-binding protein [Pseudooceanicola]MBT9385389.1 hypothetical protein [Pseudooceanicola endophyticus]MXN18752.1 hypothetical protein [Pseudooceanicola albus]
MAHFARTFAAASALSAALSLGAQAETPTLPWTPSGQITMMIGFQAGGGADSLARVLSDALSATYGWTVVPENIAGRGGAAMAEALKKEPADGLTIGFTVSQSLAYDPQIAMIPTYGLEDFDFLSSVTGSQVGIVARADRGWKTLGDVIEAARAGQKISFAAMTQQLSDGTYVIGKHNGVAFTSVNVQGGRGGVNAVMAQDVDIAWAGGTQASSVSSGDLVNLASGEATPLIMSPDAPLLSQYDVPYDFGAKFLLIAPAGLPEEVKTSLEQAVAGLLNDPDSALHTLTVRNFSGPEVVQGAALRAAMQQRYDQATKLIDDAAE